MHHASPRHASAVRPIPLALWLAFVALPGTTAPVAAFVAEPRTGPAAETALRPGEIGYPGGSAVRLAGAERRLAFDRTPAWRQFRARHGAWNAVWNEATATPHRAVGPGIPLAGFADDPASVDRGVRTFVADHPGVFGVNVTLRTLSVRRHGHTWYASYRQVVDGLDVLFADWEFRVGRGGRLVLFGADAQSPPVSPRRLTRLPEAVLRQAATAGLPMDVARDRVESNGEIVLLPIPGAGGVELRPALRLGIATGDPPDHWITYVDTETGRVLLRTNRARNAISGRIQGRVHPALPTDPFATVPFPHAFVTVGGTPVVTDANGNYTAPAAGTVTLATEIKGQYADVTRLDVVPLGSGDASYSTTATDPATVDLVWGSAGISHDAERDAYVHVNTAHAHAKQLEPSFTGLDYSMPIVVNVPNVHCNARWNGEGIAFYSAGGGCVNTATIADVAYHEYGHGVNDYVYVSEGVIDGMFNGSLHEGMADVYAAFMQDDPVIGEGFTGPGTFVRDMSVPVRWPQDNIAEAHANGLIVAGAFWDLRQAVGLATAERLSHQAKHGIPDDPRDPLAFFEMFLEVLVADDDDGDLANGTPHAAAIATAFDAHGIGASQFIDFSHTAITDRPAGGLFAVRAIVGYSGPAFTALDPTSPTLHYAINRESFVTAPMHPTGLAGEYAANLPAPVGSVVTYYITASDTYGGLAALPQDAPDLRVFRFLVGLPDTRLAWDMETDPGWTVGGPDDDAATGLWVRTDPTGTEIGAPPDNVIIQPGVDHTAAGSQCWVTGDTDTLLIPGAADVDAGRTTLATPAFDAVTGGVRAFVEYYRWFTNNTGNFPSSDPWVVEISNDGGATWTTVENTPVTTPSWERVLFRVQDYVTPTATMKLRFVASDEGGGSLVEAAVDDFRLLVMPNASLAVDPHPATLELAAAAPNPSSGPASMRLSLPAASRLRLVILDVAGRRVRTLADDTFAAGPHTVTWDGRDGSGALVPSGIYFARLESEGEVRTRRVLRTR